MESFNWLAILVASVLPLVFGGLWYSKSIFEAFTGEKSSARKHAPWVYGLCYILAIPIAFTLAIFHLGHDAQEQIWSHGAFHGSMLGLLVGLPILGVHFSFEGDRSLRNALYHIVYWVISISLIGMVVFAIS